MKTKILASLTMVLAVASSLFAQPEKKKEDIKAMKIGFITNELNLTPDEAQKFWPVYNEFQKKRPGFGTLHSVVYGHALLRLFVKPQ